MSDDQGYKIIPRNLTAMADIAVAGNPINTRPESGVDNCYPGLEFDQRNLDKRFFPGLVFEFHRSDGAVLRSTDDLPGSGLTEADFGRNIFLVGLAGQFGFDATASFRNAIGLNGLGVWRLIHDLQPGPVVVVVARDTGTAFDIESPAVIEKIRQARDDGKGFAVRDGKTLVYATFVGERARYLDEDGVVDPDTYRPGELSQSLCVPWQYDFRDCGCWYWASNKPDVVTSEEGRLRHIDFMRDLRGPLRDEADVAGRSIRATREMGYNQMMTDWQRLAIVLDDHESVAFEPEEAPAPTKLLSRDAVVAELRKLAGVEHALCVEYLYAHYSLDAARDRPDDDAADFDKRRYEASNAVFRVAIDEMRHLRWVNQSLRLLEGAAYVPALDRADVVSTRLNQQFALRPLLPRVLQDFIDVEAPSRVETDGLDGMYVRVLRSIQEQPGDFKEIGDELIGLVKLIIDEGEDHFERFSNVQRVLSEVPVGRWFRASWGSPEEPQFGQPTEAENPEDAALQQLSDMNYSVMLRTLHVAFASPTGDVQRTIDQARRAMFNMHDVNRLLVERGERPLFRLSDTARDALAAGKAADRRAASENMRGLLDALGEEFSTPPLIALFGAQRTALTELLQLG
ncbi:MAG: hypothetical protein GKR94_32565 [Gammaproteobacteria bacterium]|nr:hypothetical protein [Gammaproteobacteria bacterium]